MSEKTLILEGDFKISPEKFIEIMWSESDFWKTILDAQGVYDFELGKLERKNLILKGVPHKNITPYFKFSFLRAQTVLN